MNKKKRFLFNGVLFPNSKENSFLLTTERGSGEKKISHHLFAKNFCAGFIEVGWGVAFQGVLIDFHGENVISGTLFADNFIFTREMANSNNEDGDVVFTLKLFAGSDSEKEAVYFGRFESNSLGGGVAKFILREVEETFFTPRSPAIKDRVYGPVDGSRL